MFCKLCGEQLQENHIFCPNCGTPVHSTPSVKNEDIQEPDKTINVFQQPVTKKKKKKSLIIRIISIVLAIIIVFVSVCGIIFLVNKKQKAKQCAENIKSIYTACNNYYIRNGGIVIPDLITLAEYMGVDTLPVCPTCDMPYRILVSTKGRYDISCSIRDDHGDGFVSQAPSALTGHPNSATEIWRQLTEHNISADIKFGFYWMQEQNIGLVELTPLTTIQDDGSTFSIIRGGSTHEWFEEKPDPATSCIWSIVDNRFICYGYTEKINDKYKVVPKYPVSSVPYKIINNEELLVNSQETWRIVSRTYCFYTVTFEIEINGEIRIFIPENAFNWESSGTNSEGIFVLKSFQRVAMCSE